MISVPTSEIAALAPPISSPMSQAAGASRSAGPAPHAVGSAPQSPLVSLELVADHRYLNVVSACLGALMERVDAISERETVTYNIQLAVHEACANIVDHAYKDRVGGTIVVGISVCGAPRQLRVDLYDSGRPFDERSSMDPGLQEPQVHGYGLFLMRELVDHVAYERVQDYNHWCLSKTL